MFTTRRTIDPITHSTRSYFLRSAAVNPMPSTPQTATSPPASDTMLTLRLRRNVDAIISTIKVYYRKRNEEAFISSSSRSRNNEDFVNVEVRLCSDCEEEELCDLMGIKFEQDKYGDGRFASLVMLSVDGNNGVGEPMSV